MNSERYVVLGLGFFLSIWNKFDTLTLMCLMVFIFWILLFFLFCLENKRKFNKESLIHIYWQTLIFNSTQNPNFPFANVVHKKDYYILIYRTYDGTIHVQNYKFSLLNVCKCIIPIRARTIHMDARKVSQFETCTVPDGLHL